MPNHRARSLRNKPTTPEEAAWKVLRTLRTEGIHVRRQHPVGKYIVDFAVMKSRLAIELDGGVHALRADEDANRDEALARLGWRTLRLRNQLAFAPDQLVDAVRTAVRNEEPRFFEPKDWIAKHD